MAAARGVSGTVHLWWVTRAEQSRAPPRAARTRREDVSQRGGSPRGARQRLLGVEHAAQVLLEVGKLCGAQRHLGRGHAVAPRAARDEDVSVAGLGPFGARGGLFGRDGRLVEPKPLRRPRSAVFRAVHEARLRRVDLAQPLEARALVHDAAVGEDVLRQVLVAERVGARLAAEEEAAGGGGPLVALPAPVLGAHPLRGLARHRLGRLPQARRVVRGGAAVAQEQLAPVPAHLARF